MEPLLAQPLTLSSPKTKDFTQEARIADKLLAHFNQTWKDRQVYYLAKERAKIQRDLMTVITDSYDHAKLSLPKWPNGRCPKRSIYENTRRNLSKRLVFSLLILVMFWTICWTLLFTKVLVSWLSWGTYLTLTGCIVHGVGVYMYLSDEGMPGGANWTIECVTQLKILKPQKVLQ